VWPEYQAAHGQVVQFTRFEEFVTSQWDLHTTVSGS
jgi:hypothetical protein